MQWEHSYVSYLLFNDKLLLQVLAKTILERQRTAEKEKSNNRTDRATSKAAVGRF